MIKIQNRKLLLTAAILIIAFAVCWIFAPKSGTKVEETTTEASAVFQEGDVILPDKNKDIPENYIAVPGKENVYKIMDGETVLGYKEKTKDGEFIDYDINIPAFFQKTANSDVIYKVLTDNGEILQYRKYNGKEWDVVDKEGNIVFAIPDNYEREDISKEIYHVKDSEPAAYKQMVRFDDGTYAWQTV